DIKTEATPETKPDEPKEGGAEPTKETPTTEEKKQGPWQRVHAAERKVKELEAKIQEFSTRKPTDDPEKLELKKRFEETEQRYKALDEEMRYIDYQRSTEFKEKYQKPYEDLAKRGIASLHDYRVTQEDGTVRPATHKDFWDVVSMASQPDARKKAKDLFGEDAQDILDWRTKLRDSYFTMEQAKEEYKAKGAERQKEHERQQQEEQTKQQQEYESHMSLWKQMNDTAIEKHKDWFVAAEDDTEGAELLKKGFELADLAWNGSDKLEPEKLIALRSAERNKAAGFRYMVHLKEKADARIAELEKELEQFKASEPGNGEVDGGEKKDSWNIDSEIAKIPRA
ncbi:MAG TPA: hypothetical protein VJ742_07790, partial [Nitrososphaera sp.]|nr:hypothetical protein [Nitrososphaera sp.]